MPVDAGFLTRKLGPLPVWAYVLGGAGLVALIAIYRRGKSSISSGTTIPASPDASSAQGILNYPPTVVVTPAGISNTQPLVTNPSGSQSPGGPTTVGTTQGAPPGFPAQGYGTIPLYKDAQGQSQIGWVPWSTQLPITGAPVQGRDVQGSTIWYPVTYGGQPGFLSAMSFQGFGGGGSGAGVGRISTKIQPGMGRFGHFVPFQVPQYVHTGRGGLDGQGAGMGEGDGMGGGMGAIARRTGIPLVRLRSLNYHLRRADGSYRRGIVRVG